MPVRTVTAKQIPAPTGITRLRAAMKPDTSLGRVKRRHRILLRLVPVILLPFAGAALLAINPPYMPQAGARAVEWLDLFFFGVAILAVIAAFGFAAWRVMKAWDYSAPDSPGRAIREFYREVFTGRASSRRMSDLLASFDVPGPRVQPVFHWMTATAFPALDSPKIVAKYWRALMRGNKAVARQMRITGIEIEQPIADVAVANVHMHVTVLHRLRTAIAVLIAVAVAVVPPLLLRDQLAAVGISYWTSVAASVALAVIVGWVMRKLLKAVVERREVAVRKILVRKMYNWRLMSGEWETQDEADISWLDPRELKV